MQQLNQHVQKFDKKILVNTISPDCLVVQKSSMPGSTKFKLSMYISHDKYMDPIDIGACLASINEKYEILIFLLVNTLVEHAQSNMPSQMKFELSVYVPHNGNMNPNIFERCPGSSEMNRDQTLKILKNHVNTILI